MCVRTHVCEKQLAQLPLVWEELWLQPLLRSYPVCHSAGEQNKLEVEAGGKMGEAPKRGKGALERSRESKHVEEGSREKDRKELRASACERNALEYFLIYFR